MDSFNLAIEILLVETFGYKKAGPAYGEFGQVGYSLGRFCLCSMSTFEAF